MTGKEPARPSIWRAHRDFSLFAHVSIREELGLHFMNEQGP